MKNSVMTFARGLGPGLLFAGTAVGTSHLVQSTRAGAVFGLGLALVIILANVVKYPAFRFGAQYAAATGTNLVVGYRRLGLWPVLFLIAVLVLADGFAIAAIALVTGGIVNVVFDLKAAPLTMVALVMVLAAGFLILGRYKWLERVNRLFMLILTLSTVVATVLVLPNIDWHLYPTTAPTLDLAAFMFIVALVGWMPTPIESSIFSSLWTIAKAEENKAAGITEDDGQHLSGVLVDFNIGYWGTAALALCFMLLGAGIMHASGVEPVDSAPGFAAQVIGLFEHALGGWTGPVIGVAALSVMFTTCLSAYDGITRALVASWATVKGAGEPAPKSELPTRSIDRPYAFVLLGLLVAAMLLLVNFMQGFRAFIDLVTSIAFLTAPVFAYLNHRVMHGADIAEPFKPQPWLRVWSLAGVVLMGGFAFLYLYLIAV